MGIQIHAMAAAPTAATPVISSVLRQIAGVSCAAFAALPAVMFVLLWKTAVLLGGLIRLIALLLLRSGALLMAASLLLAALLLARWLVG